MIEVWEISITLSNCTKSITRNLMFENRFQNLVSKKYMTGDICIMFLGRYEAFFYTWDKRHLKTLKLAFCGRIFYCCQIKFSKLLKILSLLDSSGSSETTRIRSLLYWMSSYVLLVTNWTCTEPLYSSKLLWRWLQ